MSRAGVSSDHAERCVGQVMPGVRGVYDRHEYLEEKAFEALPAQIERMVNQGKNIVPLRTATAAMVEIKQLSAGRLCRPHTSVSHRRMLPALPSWR